MGYVRIGGNELDALYVACDDVVESVATPPAYADHFNLFPENLFRTFDLKQVHRRPLLKRPKRAPLAIF
jgi:hypothetical protein